MLKAGIFLDIENLTRCGGWGMRYNVIRDLVAAQNMVVLRANAYMSIDRQREAQDEYYRQRQQSYREAIRRNGFHVVLKEIRRYNDSDGQTITRANSDMDLAIDALLQAQNLDYVLLGSGDGDFVRLVRALQNQGKRVDLLSFSNTGRALTEEVDYHFRGPLIPGLLPTPKDQPRRMRGLMHHVVEDKGFGFLNVWTSLKMGHLRDDVFCHITDFTINGEPVSNQDFARLKAQQLIIEFDLLELEDGKVKAINATLHGNERIRRPQQRPGRRFDDDEEYDDEEYDDEYEDDEEYDDEYEDDEEYEDEGGDDEGE